MRNVPPPFQKQEIASCYVQIILIAQCSETLCLQMMDLVRPKSSSKVELPHELRLNL